MEVFDVTNPRCNEQIFPVPWHFIKIEVSLSIISLKLKVQSISRVTIPPRGGHLLGIYQVVYSWDRSSAAGVLFLSPSLFFLPLVRLLRFSHLVKVLLRSNLGISLWLHISKIYVKVTYLAKFGVQIWSGSVFICTAIFVNVLPPLLDSKNDRE